MINPSHFSHWQYLLLTSLSKGTISDSGYTSLNMNWRWQMADFVQNTHLFRDCQFKPFWGSSAWHCIYNILIYHVTWYMIFVTCLDKNEIATGGTAIGHLRISESVMYPIGLRRCPVHFHCCVLRREWARITLSGEAWPAAWPASFPARLLPVITLITQRTPPHHSRTRGCSGEISHPHIWRPPVKAKDYYWLALHSTVVLINPTAMGSACIIDRQTWT